jgi:hypothetical protein
MKTKVVAPIALSVGLLGIVGGVAATQAFHPVAKPAQVRLVQPAAQTITVAPSPTTTTTPAPVKTTAATPKVVKPAPVQSTQAVAPAPRTVQKAAVVSSDTSSSAPAPSSEYVAPSGAPAGVAGPSGLPPVSGGQESHPNPPQPAPSTSTK